MAMFAANQKPRVPGNAVPYYPSPNEQAAAIPGNPASLPMPRRGMFGAQMVSDLAPGQGAGFPATNGAGAYPAPVALTDNLPTPRVDLSNLAMPIDLANAQVRKPGFFQSGGLGERLLKGFAEWGLRHRASSGDPYALMVFRNRYDQQQAGVRTQEDARRRQLEREEWAWREQWKQQHPDDQFTQYMQAAGIDPRSPQGQALYRQRAESMAAPPMMAVDSFDPQGNQTKTFYPRTAFGGGMGGQPASAGPAVGTVRNGYRFNGGNPNDRNSWVPVGGASPAGGATFR